MPDMLTTRLTQIEYEGLQKMLPPITKTAYLPPTLAKTLDPEPQPRLTQIVRRGVCPGEGTEGRGRLLCRRMLELWLQGTCDKTGTLKLQSGLIYMLTEAVHLAHELAQVPLRTIYLHLENCYTCGAIGSIQYQEWKN